MIGRELEKRIHAEFATRIFLSYRKLDRGHANKLMHRIHSDADCRDVAIWYDEFLVPGEDFIGAIRDELKDCSAFTLLVTPNLVKLADSGDKNFVMKYEYPAALEEASAAKVDNKAFFILPVEMEDTDHDELKKYFSYAEQNCVHYDDGPMDELFNPIRALRLHESRLKHGSKHDYLIGLAYLNGIYVEVDRAQALKLITSAAEAEFPEAMTRLASMYHDGVGVDFDYHKALEWRQKYLAYCVREYGKDNPETLSAMNNLAVTYSDLGEYQKALELKERCYELRRKVLGDEHPDTLGTLNNLANTYGDLGKHKKALELQEKCYELRRKVLGDEHPDTIRTLNNLAATYIDLGEYQKALELQERCYELRRRVLGDEHPDTLNTLNNLAVTYGDLGEHKKALELSERCYELYRKVLGDEHPDTLMSLNNMAITYGDLGEYQKALELKEKCYELYRKVLGDEHPNTFASLNNMAITYGDLGEYQKALELTKKCYELRRKVVGDEHPYTLMSLNNLAATYGDLGEHKKALELEERCYDLRRKVLGDEHPYTLITLYNLAVGHYRLGDYDNALKRCDIIAQARTELPPKLITSVAGLYDALGQPEKAAAMREHLGS